MVVIYFPTIITTSKGLEYTVLLSTRKGRARIRGQVLKKGQYPLDIPQVKLLEEFVEKVWQENGVPVAVDKNQHKENHGKLAQNHTYDRKLSLL